ncbi:MAG: undecaprenyldiphospho-muramoylpentapeptide beta-N-acetylglucosaminyltransferase, partial [Eggerthellaceae bacterium]|nr:undecaprenyldiphospho-muramoylpentapeptide beta-N-acetylglucosaminyltransferase [Eggerthellaceae bacterium]
MTFVLSGGGTAGHINPAIALGEELEARNHKVHFAGTPQGLEATLIPEYGFEFKSFEATGFDRSKPLTGAKALCNLFASTAKARKWFRKIKPDAAVCFGAYVSLPIGRAAKAEKIPIIIHEQNSVMGMANKSMSKYANKICMNYPEAGRSVRKSRQDNIEITGNPVRKQIVEASREEGRRNLGIKDDETMLLVFGGSLGAKHINFAVADMKDKLLNNKKLVIVHLTGKDEYNRVLEQLNLNRFEAKRWKVLEYQDKMGETLAASDLILSRAGASSLAEISALCKPALLIPYPYATANHQHKNAKLLQDIGCAKVLSDKDLDYQIFDDTLNLLISHKACRKKIEKALRKADFTKAVGKLADIVEKSTKTNKK